jgi:hypothetical protein
VAAELPDALTLLLQDLTARGYGVSMDHGDDAAFGNRVIELEARSVGPDRPNIRLVKDRGLWDVDIKFDDRWHGLFRLALAVDSAKYQRRALSHDERRQLTVHVLDALPHANRVAISDRLDEYGAAAMRELSRPPSTDG